MFWTQNMFVWPPNLITYVYIPHAPPFHNFQGVSVEKVQGAGAESVSPPVQIGLSFGFSNAHIIFQLKSFLLEAVLVIMYNYSN